MTIDELIAEELTQDSRADAATEPIRIVLDAEGEFVIETQRPRKAPADESRTN